MGSASHLATRLQSGWLRSGAVAGVTLAAYLLPAALGDAFCASWGEMSGTEAISAANKRDLLVASAACFR